MKLYEILLPVLRNDGGTYAPERADYLRRIGEAVGGYTVFAQVRGHWHGQNEYMVPVRVACDPVQWRNLVSLALVTFPDQESILHYVLADDITFAERAPAGEARDAHAAMLMRGTSD